MLDPLQDKQSDEASVWLFDNQKNLTIGFTQAVKVSQFYRDIHHQIREFDIKQSQAGDSVFCDDDFVNSPDVMARKDGSSHEFMIYEFELTLGLKKWK